MAITQEHKKLYLHVSFNEINYFTVIMPNKSDKQLYPGPKCNMLFLLNF